MIVRSYQCSMMKLESKCFVILASKPICIFICIVLHSGIWGELSLYLFFSGSKLKFEFLFRVKITFSHPTFFFAVSWLFEGLVFESPLGHLHSSMPLPLPCFLSTSIYNFHLYIILFYQIDLILIFYHLRSTLIELGHSITSLWSNFGSNHLSVIMDFSICSYLASFCNFLSIISILIPRGQTYSIIAMLDNMYKMCIFSWSIY